MINIAKIFVQMSLSGKLHGKDIKSKPGTGSLYVLQRLISIRKAALLDWSVKWEIICTVAGYIDCLCPYAGNKIQQEGRHMFTTDLNSRG